MCTSPEKKKLININNLIAEIGKVERIEKEIALINSTKTIAFTKKWHIINNIFKIETGKLLGKNLLEKRIGFFLFFFFDVVCFVRLFVCFFG